MGSDALLTSGVTEKMLYLVRDSRAISPDNPLNKVRKSRIMLFLLVELLGFGATFAVTQVGQSPRLGLTNPLSITIMPGSGSGCIRGQG